MRVPARRIVAIVLPELLVELARPAALQVLESHQGKEKPHPAPLAVLLVESELESPKTTAPIDAVSREAFRLGIRAGQTVAEASAFVSKLMVREIPRVRVEAALGEIAEMALRLGTTASIQAPDTVWIDITGVAHLHGGEKELLQEIFECVGGLGHVVRVASADGPLLARAFARWLVPEPGSIGIRVVPSHASAIALGELPVTALPLDSERTAWLVRLGLRTIGDLARLPRAAAAARLGERARVVLDLAEGSDPTPLVAYEPRAVPTEETLWDDPVEGSEPLLFVLRGLVARLSARLEGRGEATAVLELDIEHDRAIARLRNAPPSVTLRFELASPLWRATEIQRVVASRLQKLSLAAPSLGLRLRATAVTRALELQLDLARGSSGLGSHLGKGPETLPIVLAELAADIGKKCFGVLELPSAHAPEDASRLVPVAPESVLGGAPKRRAPKPEHPPEPEGTPNRLLPCPVPFDAPLHRGASVSFEHRMYTVRHVEFARRLDRVGWWTERPVSRDYLRVWLEGTESDVEALVFVDRETGQRFLQGVLD